MTIATVLVEPGSLVPGATIQLDSQELHHLTVRRAADGDRLRLFDGEGGTGTGALRGSSVLVDDVQRTQPRRELVLAVGAGDRDRFAQLAERCTELGVSRLIPLDTVRSRTVETRLRGSVVEKLRRRAREACKQCLNPWATRVDDISSIAALGDFQVDNWFIADIGASPSITVAVPGSVGVIVGPEGGLVQEEVEQCCARLNARRIGLGPYVLRFDTAAIAAAALITAHGLEPQG